MCFRAEPSRQSLILPLHQTGMRSAFSLSSAVSLIDRGKRNDGDQPPINQTSLPLILFSCITPRVKAVVFALKTLKCHLRQGSKALIRKPSDLCADLLWISGSKAGLSWKPTSFFSMDETFSRCPYEGQELTKAKRSLCSQHETLQEKAL